MTTMKARKDSLDSFKSALIQNERINDCWYVESYFFLIYQLRDDVNEKNSQKLKREILQSSFKSDRIEWIELEADNVDKTLK